MKKFAVLLLFILFISGCAYVKSVGPVERSRLTPGMVEKEIIKGVTSQNEILEAFGAPNIITKNKSGNEVWTYDKVSVERATQEGYGTLIIVGIGGRKGATSTRTFTLMIEFDEEKVVREYSYRSSAF